MAGTIAKSGARAQPAGMSPAALPVSRAAGAIFVLAATGLAYQIALTRIFSLLFQYHYVFLVVSMAILGLGLGAAAGYGALRWGMQRGIVGGTLALALTFPLSAWLLTRVNSADLTIFAGLAALLPFALIGWVNALVYARVSASGGIGLVYGADLTGAALGPLLAWALIPFLGPVGLALALGTLAAAAALLLDTSAEPSPLNPLFLKGGGDFQTPFLPSPTRGEEPGVGGKRGIKTRFNPAPLLLLVALFALTLLNRATGFLNYDPAGITTAPPDKTMVRVLNANPNAEIIATRWHPFAQIDVVATDDPSARFVFTDAGAGSVMLRDDPNGDFRWIDREAAFLPFATGKTDTVLVIGAGAGFDVFLARHAGAQNITAVEINPAMVAITREMADYNGGILDLPGVTTVITDGRSFTDRDTNTYDLVYLNIVYSQAATPGTSALAENTAFTVEALRSYWKRLSENGRVAFVLHNGLEGVRLLVTSLRALEQEGLSLADALQHVALVMTANAADPTAAPSVLILNRQPWRADEAEMFSISAARRGMQPMYIPHRAPDALAVLANGSMTLDQYVASNPDYNIFPTTDNQPFFYHLDPGLPPALRTLLALSGLLTSGYLIVMAALQPKNAPHEWTRINLAAYFALLGVGFMLVEIAAMQRFNLLLGDPVLALATTLGALLLGAGLGSLFSRRFESTRAIPVAALALSAAVLASIAVYPLIVQAALPLPLFLRVGVTALALLLLGFLMGIPFPAGLRAAALADPNGVPLFWGVNAVASTFGAALATALAVLFGYPVVLIGGALAYLAVAGLVRFTWARVVG